ncbi:MAG: radical SAM protein [Candidatus Bathyarchaeota archaeon]|nr:radical SAM protein [Candidatus Bathyarchaeota archaeon]MDH5494836.1 radical SAM protein [Candidatus Bathyarchaeota archaeon]
MYDPVILAQHTRKIVVRGNLRKYYRKVRSERWYGGIAGAYCCGCNLRCVFCWSGFPRDNPDKIGDFYTPEQVFNQLKEVAHKKGYRQIRITGNEPTIGRDHLFGVLELVDQSNLLFILETNGILIGHDKQYAEQLSKFKNLHVRVSLKATNPEKFSKLTGAKPEAFEFQLKALRNLIDSHVSFNPSIMMSFCSPSGIQQLMDRLREIDQSLASNLEEEYVILYPPVVVRLKEAGIEPVI